MGTNAWRFIVAIPGHYRESTVKHCASTTRPVNFLLVRSTRRQPWRILGIAVFKGD